MNQNPQSGLGSTQAKTRSRNLNFQKFSSKMLQIRKFCQRAFRTLSHALTVEKMRLLWLMELLVVVRLTQFSDPETRAHSQRIIPPNHSQIICHLLK